MVRTILIKIALNLVLCKIRISLKQASLSALVSEEFLSVHIQKLTEPFT